MIGRWVSTLKLRYPRLALRGRAVFAGAAGLAGQALVYAIHRGQAAFAGAAGLAATALVRVTNAATFAGATGLVAAARRHLRALAAFLGGSTLAANGAVHGIQYYHTLMVGSYVGQEPFLASSGAYARAKMFGGGVVASGSGELGSTSMLAETVDGAHGETPATGFAMECFTRLSRGAFLSAAPAPTNLSSTLAGSSAYNFAKSHVQAAKTLLGSDLPAVQLVFWFQGYGDQNSGNANYAAHLASFQASMNTDLKAITGQAADVPLYVLQNCVLSPTQGAVNPGHDKSNALLALAAHRANPTKVVLVGPDYGFTYSGWALGTYPVHVQRSIGCTLARTLARIQNGGTPSPVMPVSIVRTGPDIDVTFNVPTPPLVLDLERVLNPAPSNAGNQYGFRYTDDSSSASISSVTITGPTTVRITLNTTPTGANRKLLYGHDRTSTYQSLVSITSLGRGNLRDSNVEPNPYGYDSYNWCVVFADPVP